MWDTEMVIIVRHMIDDLGDTPTYENSRLAELLLVCAQLVQQSISFQTAYVVDVDAFTLSPDPTDRAAGTRDDAFINLVCLKAACQLTKAEAKTASGQAIDIKDGKSSVGLKGIAPAKLAIAKQFCQDFEDTRFAYIAGNRNAGEAIVSPFKLGAHNYMSSYCRHNSIFN